jgi:chlorophyll synthase
MGRQFAPEMYAESPVATSRADFWRAVLELMKPLTWFAPMWAFLCGAVSSGASPSFEFIWRLFLGALLAGPLMCAMSQVMNDFCDREVDKINEPNRPFPSGRISETQGLWLCAGLTALSMGMAWVVGEWRVLAITVAAFVMSLLYSAPPVRGKRNGWFGNGLVSFAYEGVAWATGCLAVSGTLPKWSWIGAVLYSIGAHGIMTLNDFKSVKGDTEMGIRSVPVQLGVKLSACVASAIMDVPQIVCVGILAFIGSWGWAFVLLVLLAAQYPLQVKLIKDPEGRAAWYNATGTTLYVLGMMVFAIAIR